MIFKFWIEMNIQSESAQVSVIFSLDLPYFRVWDDIQIWDRNEYPK